jgi:hypothetical protein
LDGLGIAAFTIATRAWSSSYLHPGATNLLSSASRSRWHVLVSILVEHVCQDVLCVLKPFHHLEVAALHRSVQRVCVSLSSLVHVCHHLRLAAKHNFSVILEIYLDDLVREAEHNCVPRPHPFLYVDNVNEFMRLLSRVYCYFFIRTGLIAPLQIGAEMLK